MTEDRKSPKQQFEAVDAAYRACNMAALREALGNPPDFPKGRLPLETAIIEYVLEHAIDVSPLSFISELIECGADPNYPDDAGFPSLITALSSERKDRYEILRLLIDRGADVNQRGYNDWTPLHHAVSEGDLKGIKILIECGADPHLETRIDYYTSPLEDAEAAGFSAAVDFMRKARPPADEDEG